MENSSGIILTDRQTDRRDVHIDLIRSIACFAVIGLHSYGESNNIASLIFYYFCGFAVPFFFMASGFFLLNRGKIAYKYSFRKTKSLLRVVALWNFTYGILKTIKNFVATGKLELLYVLKFPIQCIRSLMQKGDLWQFWFLGALIIIYIILPYITMLNEKHRRLLLVILGSISVLVQLVSMKKGYPIQKSVIQTFRIWTWLFYFTLGGEVKKCELFANITVKKHTLIWVLWTVSLIIFQIYVSRYIMTDVGVRLNAEYFYDSIFEMIWVLLGFTLLMRLNVGLNTAWLAKKIAEISMGMYIIHPLLIRAFSHFFLPNTFFKATVLLGLTIVASAVLTIVIKSVPIIKSSIKF